MVTFTAPYRIKTFVISPFKLGMSGVFNEYFLIGAIPLIFIFSHSMIYANENRQKERIL